jgi:hypothetical protein
VLKRWLRYVENINGEGKRFGRGLVDFQVDDVKGSVDLMNCQEAIGDILIFQVGKGEEMSSTKVSCQQGVLTDGEEAEERPHPYEDTCETTNHVNEDDEKLKTSVTKEKEHRSVLVIGGI